MNEMTDKLGLTVFRSAKKLQNKSVDVSTMSPSSGAMKHQYTHMTDKLKIFETLYNNIVDFIYLRNFFFRGHWFNNCRWNVFM